VLGSLLAVVLQVGQARGSAQGSRAARARQLALACLLFTATAVVLLLAQDLVEFSWRYQLLAVITLPPAGILGVSALLALRQDRAELPPPATAADSAAQPSADTPRPAGPRPASPRPASTGTPDQPGGEPGPAGA
jgi:hypothetical protein